MEKKFTKKDMFTAILCVAEGEGFPEGITADMVADFCKAQIELLNKRSTATRKPTKVQVENEGYKARILEHMAAADSPLSVKEIWGGIPELSELSNQRVTHLLKALVDAGQVEQMKGKPCRYSLK
jgi:hypothetical protein